MRAGSDSEASFKFNSDQEEDPEADLESEFEEDEEEDVKPWGSSRRKVSVSSTSNRTMDLSGLRKKRAEDNKRRKEEAAPLLQIKKEMMKTLKRKLTWAETNSIALNYVSLNSLNSVWSAPNLILWLYNLIASPRVGDRMGRFESRDHQSGAHHHGGASEPQINVAAVPEGEFVLDEAAGGGTLEGRNVG